MYSVVNDRPPFCVPPSAQAYDATGAVQPLSQGSGFASSSSSDASSQTKPVDFPVGAAARDQAFLEQGSFAQSWPSAGRHEPPAPFPPFLSPQSALPHEQRYGRAYLDGRLPPLTGMPVLAASVAPAFDLKTPNWGKPAPAMPAHIHQAWGVKQKSFCIALPHAARHWNGIQSLSALCVDDQPWLLMTQAIFRSSFGKVRFGSDRNDRWHAVKVFRLQPEADPQLSRRTLQPRIKAVPERDVWAEVERTIFLQNIIERVTNSAGAGRGDSALKAVRGAATSFEVRRVVKDLTKPRMFVVMTADVGSLWSLRAALPGQARPLAALSVALQGFVTLTALHRIAHWAHLDIKLGNFTFTASGQVRLIDFGHSRPLDRTSATVTTPYFFGSIVAPEMRDPTRYAVGAATDVFALAATVFDMASTACGANPFAFPEGLEKPDALAGAIGQIFDAFDAFRRQASDGSGRVRARLLPEGNPFSAFFRPFMAQYPQVGEYLINRAMAPDPASRSEARDVRLELERYVLKQRGDLYEPLMDLFGHAAATQFNAESNRTALSVFRSYDPLGFWSAAPGAA